MVVVVVYLLFLNSCVLESSEGCQDFFLVLLLGWNNCQGLSR